MFDYFKSISAKGVECTAEVFQAVTHEESLVPLYNQIAAETDPEKRQQLKRKLPAFTFQAHFPDGNRSNASAVTSGLFMIDIDHIDNPYALYNAKVAPKLMDLNIALVHKTPSTKGLRIVAVCNPKFKSIAENQSWLAQELSVEQDEACKDAARLSYAVHYSYIYYLNPKKLFNENDTNTHHESAADSNECVSDTDCLGSDKQTIRPSSPSTLTSNLTTYRGKRISDIAADYVSHFGSPVQGERHTYYYRMCSHFKYICDSNKDVLLSELPNFGLSLAERRNECDHACGKPTGGSIPKEFYFFLKSVSLSPALPTREGTKSAEKLDAELETMLEEDQKNVSPSLVGRDGERLLPPVFSNFARISPPDFILPQTYVIMPALGSLLHVKAQYLDGKFHTPTFHNVIYAPAGTGKSYARSTIDRLMRHVARRDKENELLELANQDAKQKAKNKKEQPESLVLPKRRQMGTFSQPKLLKRQRANGDMHTLVYLEEIDTLMKSKRGYGGNDLSDMFRIAFDNATYSQDVVCDTTFNGEVNLYLNFCVTGTEDQLMRCYKNPDDGLVTRIGLCPIKNQEYADTPIWKCLTKKDDESIEACLDFCDALTYETDDEGVEHILDRTDITEEMQFMYPFLNEWLEEKRMQALKSQDRALDIFRRRVAVKMFRLGMVCWGCYCGVLNDERRELIQQFCLWWGEQDLQNLLDKYGDMVEDKPRGKHSRKDDIFAILPEKFVIGDVETARIQCNIMTNSSAIIYKWKQAGLIRKEFKTYVKVES